jgi:hypothetical protein
LSLVRGDKLSNFLSQKASPAKRYALSCWENLKASSMIAIEEWQAKKKFADA